MSSGRTLVLWGFVSLFAILRQVLAMQPRLPPNPRSPCLSFKSEFSGASVAVVVQCMKTHRPFIIEFGIYGWNGSENPKWNFEMPFS